jgi:hypothetical protein
MITYTTFDGAVIWRNEKNQLHRLDGPAYESTNGYKSWWLNGLRHRLNGPAVESPDGFKSWWLNGKLHRLDGPAKEWYDGEKQWFIEGYRYTEEQFIAKIDAMNRPCKGKKVTVDGVEYTLA